MYIIEKNKFFLSLYFNLKLVQVILKIISLTLDLHIDFVRNMYSLSSQRFFFLLIPLNTKRYPPFLLPFWGGGAQNIFVI